MATNLRMSAIKDAIEVIKYEIEHDKNVTESAVAKHSHKNIGLLNNLAGDGTGNKYLSDDGSYKEFNLNISNIIDLQKILNRIESFPDEFIIINICI